MAKYCGDIPCVKLNGIIHITKCATECLCGQKWSYSRPSNREDFKTENIIWRNLNAVTCEKCKELGVKKENGNTIDPSISFHNISCNQMLLALYPDIIKKAFAEYEKRLSEQTLQNEMEKKAAEWGGVIDAVQDSSSRRKRLEKRLIYLKDYLQKYDDVSEQIYNSFSKEIAEIEEELGKLGG